MIKSRKLKETDKVPFLAVCESGNGSMLIVSVERFEFADRIIAGQIIRGLDEVDDLKTGLRRSFNGGEWSKLISTKDRAEKPADLKIEISERHDHLALRWCVNRAKRRGGRGPWSPIWLTYEEPVGPATVAAHIIKQFEAKHEDWLGWKVVDIHAAQS